MNQIERKKNEGGVYVCVFSCCFPTKCCYFLRADWIQAVTEMKIKGFFSGNNTVHLVKCFVLELLDDRYWSSYLTAVGSASLRQITALCISSYCCLQMFCLISRWAIYWLEGRSWEQKIWISCSQANIVHSWSPILLSLSLTWFIYFADKQMLAH